MKLTYWLLMVLPGTAFFMDDFGEYTIPLRIFGICLILVVVYDIIKKKDISQYICKTIYFPIFIPIWMMKLKAEKKRKKREQRLRYYRPWYIL